MSVDSMVTTLKSLKLFGMAGAVDALAEQGAPAWSQSVAVLEGLIKAEVAEREVRSVNYQMKVARFPAHRDLAGFDFKENAVNEALVRTLHRGEHIDTATKCLNSASTESLYCRLKREFCSCVVQTSCCRSNNITHLRKHVIGRGLLDRNFINSTLAVPGQEHF